MKEYIVRPSSEGRHKTLTEALEASDGTVLEIPEAELTLTLEGTVEARTEDRDDG